MKIPAIVRTALLLFVLASIVAFDGNASAHCQVPCGIYDDPARIARLQEDAATISKATDKIAGLAGAHDAQGLNQAVRWINTKELHASHILEICSEYFLTQKIKPVAMGAEGREAYLEHLATVHAVMVAAMKTKQTVSREAVAKLEEAIAAMAAH